MPQQFIFSRIQRRVSNAGNPMLDLRAVTALLDLDHRQVAKLVEGGEMGLCFDIALDPKRSRSKCYRFLAPSIMRILRGDKPFEKWDEVEIILFPRPVRFLSMFELQRLLNGSDAHAWKLLGANAISVMGGYGRGPSRPAAFPTDSIKKFLKSRIIV